MISSARSRRAVLGVVAAAILFASAAGPATAAPGPWHGDGGNSAAAQADHKPAGTGSGRKIG